MYKYLIVALSILALILAQKETQKNVYNQELQICSTDPITGYNRNGYCETLDHDEGTHVVCASMTDEFLQYTKSMGNDLSTKSSYFPGLKNGDHWCLCALRWKQAYEAGKAPPVIFEATNLKALQFASLEDYKKSSSDSKITIQDKP